MQSAARGEVESRFTLANRSEYPTSDQLDLGRASQVVIRSAEAPVLRQDPVFFAVDRAVSNYDAEYDLRFVDQRSVKLDSAFALSMPLGRVLTDGFFVVDEINRLSSESMRTRGLLAKYGFSDHGERDFVHEELGGTKKCSGAVAVLGIQTNLNYFHWIYEALPRLWLLRKLELPGPVAVLVPPMRPWMAEALALVGGKELRLIEHDDGSFQADQLILPARGLTSINTFAWHAMEMVKELAADGASPGIGGKRYFVSRERAGSRRLINEEEIFEIASSYGFEIVHPEEFSVQEQVAMFSSADTIAGPLGAGLANAGFMKAGSSLLEFAPEQRAGDATLFANLAHHRDLRYAGVVGSICESEDRPVDRRRFSIPPELAKQAFEALFES